MASHNQVILVGHLGKDPELKYTAGGAAMLDMSLATSEKYKDKEGKWVDHTEWHAIKVWNKQAEHCKQYLRKGSQIMVNGKLTTRTWDDKDGKTYYKTEVVAEKVSFLDKGQIKEKDAVKESTEAELNW